MSTDTLLSIIKRCGGNHAELRKIFKESLYENTKFGNDVIRIMYKNKQINEDWHRETKGRYFLKHGGRYYIVAMER